MKFLGGDCPGHGNRYHPFLTPATDPRTGGVHNVDKCPSASGSRSFQLIYSAIVTQAMGEVNLQENLVHYPT